ncbi:hypothetical protein [Leptospira sp. mild_001]|uniref:hypothetical protein n=1 Tax=Leptospira sp. mild_001 TaxID=2838238 RepID=UPI001E5D5D76|nr:hypothetical protein [Leptospira sp. mild_001]
MPLRVKLIILQKSNEYYTSLTPQFTTYQYNDPDGELTTILEPSVNGMIQTSITKTGFTETRDRRNYDKIFCKT